MGFLSDSKDRLIETMALPVVRSALSPYGTTREIRLNTTDKSAELLIDLKGERDPLRVAVEQYEISQVDGETFVTIHAIRTSREWMTVLAEQNVVGRALRVPEQYAGMLLRLV